MALVTARAAVGLDEDMPPLTRALGAAGVDFEVVSWDDGGVDWPRFSLAVVRSTWDYPSRRDEFLAWVDRVAATTELANPAPVLHWNTDKRYLRDLAAHGVPTVETAWFEPGDRVAIERHREVVVKPAVSAGARDTARYPADAHDAAVAHVRSLQGAGRVVMVQPYLDGVDREGETAVVHLGGTFSHGIGKGPILRAGDELVAGLFAAEEIGPRVPTGEQLEVAALAIAAVPVDERLLYARVDLVPGPDGRPVLLELELTEPSFFLVHATGAAERFARAIAARSGTGGQAPA